MPHGHGCLWGPATENTQDPRAHNTTDLCPVTQLQILSNGLLGLARITCSITVFLLPEKRSAGRLADGNLGLDWTAP